MKINIEFLGLTMVSDVVGKKKLELDISGTTVKERGSFTMPLLSYNRPSISSS